MDYFQPKLVEPRINFLTRGTMTKPTPNSIQAPKPAKPTRKRIPYECVVSDAFNPTTKLSGSMTDKLARLNEILLYKTITVKKRLDFGHWINLDSKWWRAEFGYHYVDIQKAAEKLGMLQFKRNKLGAKSYCSNAKKAPIAKKHFSVSCRLGPEFRTLDYKIWTLRRQPRTKPPTPRNLSPVGQKLAQYLLEMVVDPTAATDARGALIASLFNRGRHWSVECRYGRFHSPLSALPKKLRATLTLKNKVQHMAIEAQETDETRGTDTDRDNETQETLIQKEESASRLGSRREGAVARSHDNSIGKRVEKQEAAMTQLLQLASSPFAIVDVKNCIAVCLAIHCQELSRATDVAHWIKTAEAGRTYETIQNWLREYHHHSYWKKIDGEEKETFPSKWKRDTVKKRFMIPVYGNSPEHPIWQAIEQLWPTVAQIVTVIKKGNYKKMAHLCQKIESSIVIQDACRKLIERLPGVPFGTIHDSIAIPAPFVDIAKQELIAAFQRRGVTPKISSSLDHDD
jgi:hypothetical protein